MMFLAEFSVIRPEWGLLFWSTVFFIAFWLIIGKFGFGPIKNALKNRESDIQRAMDAAEEAKREVAEMKSKNEELLKEAQAERMQMLTEARETKEQIIKEAKEKANAEYTAIVSAAKSDIENEKQAAILEVKNQLGQMALGIAEKMVIKDLGNEAANVEYVNRLVEELN